MLDVQLGDPSKVGSTGHAVTPPVVPTPLPKTPLPSGGGTIPVPGANDGVTPPIVVAPDGGNGAETLAIPIIRRSLGAGGARTRLPATRRRDIHLDRWVGR